MNAKKFFLLTLSLVQTVFLWAGIVPVEEALQTARDFIISQQTTHPGGSMRMASAQLVLEQAVYRECTDLYVFNCGTDDGFVIVSADDRTQPILGYADTGTFDEAELPENLRHWLEDYAEQIRQLDFLGLDSRLSAVPLSASRHSVPPMLACKWGQHGPYNEQCPVDPVTNELSLTGCGATAMAQALYYFQYPARTTTVIPGYTTETREISMPSISRTNINWQNIVPIYNNGNTTAAQEQAVASLIKLCASSLMMDFSSESSTSSLSDIAYALRKYFGYDAGLQATSHFGIGMNQWDETIYGELAAGRPVVYRGTRDREGRDSGHLFVIDGYDVSGYYHLNWGWDGKWNGYFLLNVLSPYVSAEDEAVLSNEGYSLGHWAIIGMQPDAGGTPPPLSMTAQGLELYETATTLQRSSTSVNFPEVKLSCKTYNFTGETNTFDIGIGLLDAAGRLVATAETATSELDPNWGWKAIKGKISFGKGLASGNYRLVNISRESGKNLPWQISKDGEYYCVYVTVNGRTLTLRDRNIHLSGNLFADSDLEAGKLNELTAHISNDGTYFSGDVYLFVDGKRSGGRYIDIAEGSTLNLAIGFTPAEEGVHELSMAYYDRLKGDSIFFATTQVNVSPAAYNSLKLNLVSTNARNKTIGTTYQVNVQAKNTNNAAYDNKLRAIIYKLRHDGSNIGDFVAQQDRHLTLSAGKTKNVAFEFKDLEDGETYFVWVYYFSNGATVQDGRVFGGQATVNVALGVPGLQADDGMTDIYNAEGMVMARCRRSQVAESLRSLPKGIYMIDGKKTVNK